MTGYKFIFYNDPTTILLAKPMEFYATLQESVSIYGPVELAAIYTECGDLIAFGNVRAALEIALWEQMKADNKLPEHTLQTHCPCYNVWRYFRQGAPRFEEVLHRAERKIVEALIERREVP